MEDFEEHTNTDDSIWIKEHQTKEAAAEKRKAKAWEQEMKNESTDRKEPTIYGQQQKETRKQLHCRNQSRHQNRTNNNEDTQESTNTDTSVRIDKHQTKELAEERKKKAREQDIRSRSTTKKLNTLPTAKQPYVLGDEDDSTEDEDLEH
jgi:hypothetical protein